MTNSILQRHSTACTLQHCTERIGRTPSSSPFPPFTPPLLLPYPCPVLSTALWPYTGCGVGTARVPVGAEVPCGACGRSRRAAAHVRPADGDGASAAMPRRAHCWHQETCSHIAGTRKRARARVAHLANMVSLPWWLAAAAAAAAAATVAVLRLPLWRQRQQRRR